MWLFFSIIPAFLWACVNHIDKYLLSKIVKGNGGIPVLFLISCFISLPVLVLLGLFFNTQLLIDSYSAVFLIINGILFSMSILPYFIALDKDETSIVAPLFQLTPVITYGLGFIFLNESLGMYQLTGAVLITIASILLVYERSEGKGKLKLSLLLLMALSCLLLAINAVLYKFISIDISFSSSIFWQHLGSLLCGILVFIVNKNYRKKLLLFFKENKPVILLFNGANETLTVVGNTSLFYASLLAPVASVLWVAEGFQPVFVFLIGWFLSAFFPQIAEEDTSKATLLKKSFCLALMIVGTIILSN
jgi:uncharacterized membrane protein